MRRYTKLVFAFAMSIAMIAMVGARGCGTDSSIYTQTKYPIVLTHGLLGFESIFGVVDYWFGAAAELEEGGAQVFVTQVPPVNSTEVRGQALLEQVEDIVAITGAGKVNLIGHSHGGQDVRWVAATRPDLVGSVTTVGGVHFGAPLADVLVDAPIPLWALIALNGLVETVYGLITGESNPADLESSLGALSTAGSAAFNATYPAGVPTTFCGEGAAEVSIDGNPVRFYSYGGVGVSTNFADIGDALMGIASLFASGPNDGLVERCSTHLGDVIRDDYGHNHLDLVNQILGLVPPFEEKPLSILRTHANRLRNAGL